MTDNSCLCHNQQFIADQIACINKACTNPSDLQQADTFAEQNCLAVVSVHTAQLLLIGQMLTTYHQGVTLTASSTPSATGSTASPFVSMIRYVCIVPADFYKLDLRPRPLRPPRLVRQLLKVMALLQFMLPHPLCYWLASLRLR